MDVDKEELKRVVSGFIDENKLWEAQKLLESILVKETAEAVIRESMPKR